MDSPNPYNKAENQVQEIIQQQYAMDQTHNNGPPPNYNNFPSQPMPSAANATVHIMPVGNQPIFPQPVGPKSMEMTCPSCRCRITTTVRHRSTSKTHIACLLLSWTICCCCLPYCMDSCRNANHFCPMCGAFIGTYSS